MPSIHKKNNPVFQQLCSCPDCILAKNSGKIHISALPGLLANLPQVKARPDFDRKMAAAFALELEEEVDRRNRSLLKKSRKISLPDVISDLSKEFM